jgi:glutathione S-transferase
MVLLAVKDTMLKLHHAPNSRAGRIVWLLEELQLPYELNRMEFSAKSLKSDEHRARHPEILGQAKRLLTKALEPLNVALDGREYVVGHACAMAQRLGCMPAEMTHLQAYVKRLATRPAFQKGTAT